MPNEHLESILGAIKSRSVNAYFMRPDQLVVCSNDNIILPENGNFFWITYKNNKFYICTWFPKCYAVPSSSDVVMLAVKFYRCSRKVETEIPENLIAKFGLLVIDGDYVP